MTLTNTDFHFPGQNAPVYHGKVRDVYSLDGDILVMVATDRISAFDVILPKGIPYKGQILNQIANYFLDATSEAVPNWKLAEVAPMATAGVKCEGFRVEMIIRGYLAGSAWWWPGSLCPRKNHRLPFLCPCGRIFPGKKSSPRVWWMPPTTK